MTDAGPWRCCQHDMSAQREINAFRRERNEALLSLDEKKIREFQRKWNGMELPADMELFWGAIHKAITGTEGDLPLEFRKKSKAWLTERGLESHDDGDL